MRRLADGGRLEWRQLVWGIVKDLEPIPVPLRGEAAKRAEVEDLKRAIQEGRFHARPA